MKKIWMYVAFLVGITACRNQSQPVAQEQTAQPETSAKKTINIDTSKQVIDTLALGKTDTAYIVKNKLLKDDIGDKQSSYQIQVHFSNKEWPVLNYENAIGADLYLVGDLNGDHQPELLLRPEWFSSCWASINLFSLSQRKWELIKKGSMYFCSEEYPLAKRIIKTTKGYGLLTDSLTDDKFITLKKEIRF